MEGKYWIILLDGSCHCRTVTLASAIDTDLPAPPEHTQLMLGSKAPCAEPEMAANDKLFNEYPDEFIAEWHKQLGLVMKR